MEDKEYWIIIYYLDLKLKPIWGVWEVCNTWEDLIQARESFKQIEKPDTPYKILRINKHYSVVEEDLKGRQDELVERYILI